MFCDGLMIATLSARPLRLRNFSAIEVDKQLFEEGGTIYLRFESHETKSRTKLEFIFPEALTDRLMSYLHIYISIDRFSKGNMDGITAPGRAQSQEPHYGLRPGAPG
jgi:hypothetical protein